MLQTSYVKLIILYIYVCPSKEIETLFIYIYEWQIKNRLWLDDMIASDVHRSKCFESALVHTLVFFWWREITLNSSANQKANPMSPSDWLWQCVTNRGRMYATLGPNWRVPLRTSPRSRSYVYRYSEVGERGVDVTLNKNEWGNRSKTHSDVFLSHLNSLTACWWRSGGIKWNRTVGCTFHTFLSATQKLYLPLVKSMH